MKDNLDVLIIGAGPSGCVAASYLNKQGFNIKVLEKSSFPRFVIGESLLPRCMDHFEEVGLLECLKLNDFEVKNGVRFIKDNKISNFIFSDKHTNGWDWTWQAPRADFDNILATEIINQGVDLSFENEVINVDFDDNGNSTTTVKDQNGRINYYKAKYIIDSSGFGRVLPRLLNLDKDPRLTNYSTVFSHISGSQSNEFRNTSIHIIDDNIWAWEIPFSNGITSFGFSGNSKYLDKFGNSSKDKFMNLFKKISPSEIHNNSNLVFEPIELKNYSKEVTKLYGKGFVLTGNSAEFLDPIFSSGVTMATESGLLAAKLIKKELTNEPVNWELEYSLYISKGVDVFRTYVTEWYSGKLKSIFFNSEINPKFKKQITSVLAGYVWDESNPFVSKHDRVIDNLAHIINMN